MSLPLRSARVLALLPVTERVLTLADLAAASEVFTASSIRGFQPVTTCLGVGTWPTGPTAPLWPSSGCPRRSPTWRP